MTDYRTAVSGVRPEDLAEAPEFKEVQAEVAGIIKDRVLVGHALHHDLKVLFLDHPKKLIRDTSKYKPFKSAFGGRTPGKNRLFGFLQLKINNFVHQVENIYCYLGLKALTERYLGVTVQTGEHSSVQDSQVATTLSGIGNSDHNVPCPGRSEALHHVQEGLGGGENGEADQE